MYNSEIISFSKCKNCYKCWSYRDIKKKYTTFKLQIIKIHETQKYFEITSKFENPFPFAIYSDNTFYLFA